MVHKKQVLAAACIAGALVLCASGSGLAVEPIGWGGSLSHPVNVQSSPFIEGLNANVPVDDARVYAALWFALPYTPSVSYLIDRVEFIHGEGTGLVTIQIRTDNGGVPSTNILTQGSHELMPPVGFQGADMPPTMLIAGVPYWVVLNVVVPSQGSVGLHDAGTEIAYFYSDDGTTWNGDAVTEVWIARFYGDATVPVEETSWGQIKGLYR